MKSLHSSQLSSQHPKKPQSQGQSVTRKRTGRMKRNAGSKSRRSRPGTGMEVPEEKTVIAATEVNMTF